MYFNKVFDGQEYSCTVIDATRYQYRRIDGTESEPRQCEGQPTLKWVEEEIHRAFLRDEMDPYYHRHQFAIDDLGDVADIRSYKMLVVLDEHGYMLGKISFYENDPALTLNVMYLYAFGDRRRANSKYSRDSHISSAYIIWYFAAALSQVLYGANGRLLITYPRSSIYKLLLNVGARLVGLSNNDDLIKASVNRCDKETHDILTAHYRLTISGIESDNDIESVGALFNAHELVTFIEIMEAKAANHRRS